MLQRYSFGTQKPDRDSGGDYVKYGDVARHVVAVEQSFVDLTAAAERVNALNAARIEVLTNVLRDVRKLAAAHHSDQPLHVLLHALTIDIPSLIGTVLDDGPQSGCRPTRFDDKPDSRQDA